MTRKEKRIEVVKDVLKQLRYLKIDKSSYLSAPDNCNISEEDNLKDKISELKRCTVCAKGALFIGHIDKFNKLTLKDVATRQTYNFLNGVVSDVTSIHNLNYEENVVQPLLSYFSQEQLDMIECAFEKVNEVNELYEHKPNIAEKCIKFGQRFSNHKLRLRRILENILENDGLFKP